MQRAAPRMLALTLGVGFACAGDDGPAQLEKPPADPTLVVDTTTTDPTVDPTVDSASSETTTNPGGDACGIDAPCPASTFCAAPNADGVTVGAGDFTCSPTCVANDEPARWCLDAASCCDAAATCETGFCRVASITTDTGTDTSSSSSTGATESGSTDTGSTGTDDTGSTGSTTDSSTG